MTGENVKHTKQDSPKRAAPRTDEYDPLVRGRFPVGVRTIQALDGVRDRLFPCEIWYPAAAQHAGQMARPYHNGSVWTLAFIRIKPGMDSAYMNYVTTEWKRIQEAAKKEGLVLSYKVLATEGHTPGDWNLILMTEVKDLATLEANEKKADALEQRLVGDDQKQMQGYRERADIREVMGNRLAREIVLEPGR